MRCAHHASLHCESASNQMAGSRTVLSLPASQKPCLTAEPHERTCTLIFACANLQVQAACEELDRVVGGAAS